MLHSYSTGYKEEINMVISIERRVVGGDGGL